MFQTTFSVIPLPHALSCLQIGRKTLPLVTFAAMSHSSIICFTQSGTGTVRMWPPLPIRSTIAQ